MAVSILQEKQYNAENIYLIFLHHYFKFSVFFCFQLLFFFLLFVSIDGRTHSLLLFCNVSNNVKQSEIEADY